jgi:hypothetical protein
VRTDADLTTRVAMFISHFLSSIKSVLFFYFKIEENSMTESSNKSKEEIALELLQIILSGTVRSGSNERSIREKVDFETSSIETKYNWYLKLFQDCLKAVKDEKEK